MCIRDRRTANDPNACVFEKMVPGTEEALAPATRGRASFLLLNSYKENAHPLIDVYEGKISLDEFTAQLDDDDLIHLLGGQPNTSVANTYGYGNLPEYGVPNIMTADEMCIRDSLSIVCPPWLSCPSLATGIL